MVYDYYQTFSFSFKTKCVVCSSVIFQTKELQLFILNTALGINLHIIATVYSRYLVLTAQFFQSSLLLTVSVEYV